MQINRVVLRKTIFSAFAILTLGLIAGCGTGTFHPASNSGTNPTFVGGIPTQINSIPTPAISSDASASNPSAESANPVLDTTSSTQQQRIIIKNASLSLTVDNPAKTVAQITTLAEGSGGWIVASNIVAAGSNGTTATVSVRVPAEKFTTIVDQIKTGAVSVDNETISGEDVTQKYVDLNSQLTNLQNTAAQLQKIMASANNVNDVLTVQTQLTTTQGQIEQIKGQIQYYSQASAFSLIDITLVQKPLPVTPTPATTPVPASLGLTDWKPGQTVYDAASALVSLLQSVVTLLIWLIVIGIPVVLIIAIGLFIWVRILRAGVNRLIGTLPVAAAKPPAADVPNIPQNPT